MNGLFDYLHLFTHWARGFGNPNQQHPTSQQTHFKHILRCFLCFGRGLPGLTAGWLNAFPKFHHFKRGEVWAELGTNFGRWNTAGTRPKSGPIVEPWVAAAARIFTEVGSKSENKLGFDGVPLGSTVAALFAIFVCKEGAFRQYVNPVLSRPSFVLTLMA